MKNNKTLENYWEEKLHIKYNEELEKYKKICGLRYKKKLVRISYSLKYTLITYEEWKQNIICETSILDINELKEYSRFLNQKMRDNEVTFNLSQTLLIPFTIFMASELVEMFIEPFNKIEMEFNIIMYIKFVTMIFFFGFIFVKLCSVREESIHKYFYQDLKDIVDEKIEYVKSHHGMEFP